MTRTRLRAAWVAMLKMAGLMNDSRPIVGIYAGSLRPGGGLTVLNQIVGALAVDGKTDLIIYTGATDTADEVKVLVEHYPYVRIIPFLPKASASLRYLASKFLFIANWRSFRFDWLISFNYHLPANCPLLVLHINLLSFQKGDHDTLGAFIKRVDARIACRNADFNVFESYYLLQQAEKSVTIRHPHVLYVGVHPDFFYPETSQDISTDILLVSSIQPHKDNLTCLRALAELVKLRSEVPWRLVVAGGQSIEQWDDFYSNAKEIGLEDRVEILGRMGRKDLSRRMNQSLCLVSASLIESFCMVAIESMASRCPAVVTSSTSMPESVGAAAVVVEPGDARQFAQACMALYDNPELRARYIAAGLKRAEEFTPEQFRHNLLRLLMNNKKEKKP